MNGCFVIFGRVLADPVGPKHVRVFTHLLQKALAQLGLRGNILNRFPAQCV